MPGRMREVELVEAADEPGRSRSGAPADQRLADEAGDDVLVARTWVRRRTPWLVTAVAVVVGSLAVTQLVLDHREDARVAALADVPGVVPPVDASVGVLWVADPVLAQALQSGALVDGLVVGGTQDETGASMVLGLDPDTGAVAWRTPVDLPVPRPGPDDVAPEVWISCTPVPHGGSPVVGCVAQQYGEDVEGRIPPSLVWVLDPADGDLLADREVPGGWGLTFTDGALVVAQPVAEDGSPARRDAGAVRWEVTATDVVDGAHRWTWTSPVTDVLGREDGPEGATATGTASLQSSDDHLVLGVDDHAWVLRTDGTPLLDVPLDDGSWLQPARAGVFIESTWTDSAYSGTLLFPDGSRLPIDETASWLSVDDGSAPDVVLTVGQAPGGADGLSGRSASTGERLWHVPGTIVTSLLLDGTVYVATSDALVAVDAVSGEVRWTTEIDHMPQQLSTDGRYLLLPGTGLELAAYTMSDGVLAWTADLARELAPDPTTVFVQGFQSGWHDPRLYVWTDTGSVAVLG